MWSPLPITTPAEWEKLRVHLPCPKRHREIPKTVKGSCQEYISRCTLGVRAVGYWSDDSGAADLIYINIWQHLRREGCSKRNGGWHQAK